MSQERLAPQQEAHCPKQSTKSSTKGGTLIAADVWTLQEHIHRLRDEARPYRPSQCPACDCNKLHVHDYRQRLPLGIAMVAALVVVRFICTNPQCRTTWRVLPAFLARYLRWPWDGIEAVTMAHVAVPPPSQTLSEVKTPAAATARSAAPIGSPNVQTPINTQVGRDPSLRTKQRWRQQLRYSAKQLVSLIAARGGGTLQAVAHAVGRHGDRMRMVRCYAEQMMVQAGRQLASVAALLHALQRGVRLM